MSAGPDDGIGVIMLAAGTSRRFGGDKRRARLPDGRSLLEASLASVPPSFSRRLLVLRPGDEELADCRQDAGWEIVVAEEAARGMGHSLASGVARALGWQGALVALGDMPFILPATFTLLREELTRHDIVLPLHRGRRGHPVGFRRSCFGELLVLEGDQGARGVLERRPDRCHAVNVEDGGVLQDIDTPEGLTEL